MSFQFEKVEIPDVIIIKPKIFIDDRGSFVEIFKEPEFRFGGISASFVQVNISKSKYGVLRGLHFQRSPYEQAKLIICLKGRIFDVVVDIRNGSPTFGKHIETILEEKDKILFVPRGFAHGFLVLSDEAEVLYIVDNVYSQKHEGGIIWNDPYLNIKWPISNPILSEKDKKWPQLKNLVTG